MGFFLNYAIPFLILVNLVALVHSGGHIIVARWFGVGIETVSIGLGPSLFKFSRNGTSWKVCILPVGGYVRAGFAVNEDGAFWKRLVTLLAGPVASILVATIVVLLLFSLNGIPIVHERQVVLVQQPMTDTLMATVRLVFLSWTNWSMDSWAGIASLQDTATARLAFLTAAVSSKVGILNLLPIPKFDGWKIGNLILERTLGSEKTQLVMMWVFRGEVAIAVFIVSYLTWNDLARLFGASP